jgi:hypothetical protein
MKKICTTRFSRAKIQTKLCANFPGLIDVVVDDTKEDGSTLFMVKEGNKIHYTAEWECVQGNAIYHQARNFYHLYYHESARLRNGINLITIHSYLKT